MYKLHLIKLFTVLSIVLFLISSEQTYGQSNSNKQNKEHLIGTWGLDYNKTINQIKADSKKNYDSLKVDKKEQIRTSFSSRKVIFSQDGTYTLIVKPGLDVVGTWQLKEDNITLVIVLKDNKSITQTIETINSSHMLLNLGGDQSTGRLFRKWYLENLTN